MYLHQLEILNLRVFAGASASFQHPNRVLAPRERMPEHPNINLLLSHSAKDKSVVRPLAERLRQDGLKVWLDDWEIPVAAVCDRRQNQRRSQSAATTAKIEAGPFKFGNRNSEFGIPRLCMSAHASGLSRRSPLPKNRRQKKLAILPSSCLTL